MPCPNNPATPRETGLVHVVASMEGRPGTHALVMGIGAYPFGRHIHEDVELRDLASPVESAKAIADWLILSYDNPGRPLASVALVVSDEEPFVYTNPATNEAHEVLRGTSRDFEICVAAWAKRAAASFENGSLFYYCGHGLSSGYLDHLLSRSFGEDPDRHMSAVFDRLSLVNPMRLLGPCHQLFLFDTCRNDAPALLDGRGRPATFLSVRPNQTSPGKVEQCSLLAAAPTESAFGEAAGKSLFASEFIEASRSAAMRRGEWWVNTSLVLEHLRHFVAGQACQLEGASLDICRMTTPPVVPVIVSCEPQDHIYRVKLEFSLRGVVTKAFDGSSEPDVQSWRLGLEHGAYDLNATCTIGEYDPLIRRSMIIYPPYSLIVIDLAEGAIKQ